ncbi:MAG: 1-(5-phosphoribosyl)-5-[(5-phosphoribosylamino)methylideneamino]imidazole-4-carboxamide isomerase [Anaerolineae bacterium]|nr:1-(5-phosphoribosyl)-5-[(5-phosphoribosylamino)methylideneamino]imidazole-4-carboxamide isomerase [Anaerolineae bacterium]
MAAFTVFPAIDMRAGRCVRLRQGDVAAEMVYSDRPDDVARRWQDAGAQWLHVVNLDGALNAGDSWSGPNVEALRAILRAVRIPVQFGGGVRSAASVGRLLDLGVARVILGTVAVTRPDVVQEALSDFGADRVLVSLDARDGVVRTHGWVSSSGRPVQDLGLELRGYGVRTVVHTDISRDGMLVGANVAASAALARATGLQVIVSGGVAGLPDVAEAARRASEGLAGVIVGQALYTGALNLADAIETSARLSTRASEEGE